MEVEVVTENLNSDKGRPVGGTPDNLLRMRWTLSFPGAAFWLRKVLMSSPCSEFLKASLLWLLVWIGTSASAVAEVGAWGKPIWIFWPNEYKVPGAAPSLQFRGYAMGGAIEYSIERQTGTDEWELLESDYASNGSVNFNNYVKSDWYGVYRFRAENSYGISYSEDFEIREPTSAPRIFEQPLFHLMLTELSNYAISFPGLKFSTSDQSASSAFYERVSGGEETLLKTSPVPVFLIDNPRTLTMIAKFTNDFGTSESVPVEILALDKFHAPLRILEQPTEVTEGGNLAFVVNRPQGIQDFVVYKRADGEGLEDEPLTVTVSGIDDTSSMIFIRSPEAAAEYYVQKDNKAIPLDPFNFVPKASPTQVPQWAVDVLEIPVPSESVSLPLILTEALNEGTSWKSIIRGKGTSQSVIGPNVYLSGSGRITPGLSLLHFVYPEGTIQLQSWQNSSLITEAVPYRLVYDSPPLVTVNSDHISNLVGRETLISIGIQGDWDSVQVEQSHNLEDWEPVSTDYIRLNLWSFTPLVSTERNWIRVVVENEYGTTTTDPIVYQPVMPELPDALGPIEIVDAPNGVFHSLVYGNFRMQSFPYLYFDSIGLTKVHGDETGRMWLAKWGGSYVEWIYSGVDTYPYVYNASRESWLRVSEEANGWAYNLTVGEWQLLD